ncbi:hypothetical protein [Pseudomonas putida]|uniref:hypothetical protein n=2 Tax=Pseudomonas putida TaxID=303 RepID=UPI001041BF65|nr:hypothetical protein [Pseudomonas putida]
MTFSWACAALRGRMRHGGNLVWDGVLRVTGMGPDHGGVMDNSDIFTTEYGDSEYTVWFTEHPNGFTFKIKVDDLPWRDFHDKTYATYAEVKAAAIEAGQRFINNMKG